MAHAFDIKFKNTSPRSWRSSPIGAFHKSLLLISEKSNSGRQAVSQNLVRILYECAWIAITKCHNIGGLNNRNLFAHSSGGWQVKIKVLSGFVFLVRPLFLACRQLAFLPFSTWPCCYWCSVAQLCPTLCDPMDCSTPGFPVLHHLLELAQTHVHWVDDSI